MWKKSKVSDQTATGQVGIKKKSKVPGVMITQFIEELPEGKSHPDFIRKPIALTIQEGKLAIFKAIVVGDPTPTVTWARNNGDISDPKKYQTKFDPNSREHTIEMPNVSPEQADTYKCFATNEFGKATVTVILNVIEVGFKKNKANQESIATDPKELKAVLKRKSKVRPKTEVRKDGEIDPKFWEILLSSDKKDYERICAEYGVTDFRWMLKKLNEMKKEREQEQAEFIKSISTLKHIDVNPDGTASFELDLNLLDPSSKIFIYKDGEMIPYSQDIDIEMKHNLNQVGKKYIFTIRDLVPDDAGLYQLDIEDVNVFSTEFKIPLVDFLVKLKDVKAMEREDAIFECVLSKPISKIMWVGKSNRLKQGEKYDITVSEDKLIHRLVVKDCMQVDKGIYAAVVGIKSCNAWLIVEADNNLDSKGKKKPRKTTQAGGAGADLAKIAAEQQVKLQKERNERITAVKTASAEKEAAGAVDSGASASSSADSSSAEKEVADVVDSGASASSTGDSSSAKKEAAGVVDSGASASSSTDSYSAEKEVRRNDSVDTGLVRSVPDTSGKDKGEGRRTTQVISIREILSSATKTPQFGGVTTGSDEGLLSGDSNDDRTHFTNGESNVPIVRGEPAELAGNLSTSKANRDGEKLYSKVGDKQELVIQSFKDSSSGQNRAEVIECKTDAMETAGDLPKFDPDDLHKFSKNVVVKVGQTASFKMPFPPQDSSEINWFKDGTELFDGGRIKVVKELNQSRLQIKECLRSDSGEIKIQLKNPFGTVEAFSRLIVVDKPGPPQGPVEVIDSSSSVIEIKWNPPSDTGGSEVTNYLVERQQVGQSVWKKVWDSSADRLSFRDRNVSHGKKYIYRIYAGNSEGTSDPLETESIMTETLIFPGQPAPPEVVGMFKNCINLTWAPPEKDGGTKILGYQLEKRKKDTNQWVTLNQVNDPIQALKYAVKDVSEGSEYEFRVSAINMSGAGEPSAPSVMVCAKNPNTRPRFKDPIDFMVVRAGNSIRIKVDYEGSPQPDITWLKNDESVSPWVNIINVEDASTLVIPSSKYSDSGVYTIMAKNSSGQSSFDIEVRVADEPKPPGPVELEQVVYGKVIITWAPSPEQEKDDRLHYLVEERDSNTRVWRTIANRLFCNTYTASVHSGREYHFRVYAKNDMGFSDPSKSPTWGINELRVPLVTSLPATITLERPPSILVPLKVHSPPQGYQLYMTCAVRGFPTPHVTWYLNGNCINTNNTYYITNTYGVCSMYIIRVGPEHSGEYRVVAVNSFGRAECSTKLRVKD
ncbi:immunoglobulin-like and fibronectin type III domain-containing protein 1 [Megalobrama amblycephala]|uniref:immunoglobulin-like and fibronectin type III domain-containing protein 1 n=1 Tax=Megalobrama amblycephala TaxID=75352 RepID=UPI0020142418|nr:immunoglobulin-like and fibronectin type III domain-containing protein 1 [Megalobrama amblycephala]